MPYEETYRFRAVLDLSELYTQLSQARSEISAALGELTSPVSSSVGAVVGGVSSGIQRFESGVSAAGGYASDVAGAAAGAFGSLVEQLPMLRSGERVGGILTAMPPGLSGPGYTQYGGSNPMYEARMRARHDYVSGGFFGEEMTAAGAGLAGAAIGTALFPGVGTLAGLAIGTAGYFAGEYLARPFTNLLFDEERARDHMMARSSLEENIFMGRGHVASGASGLMRASVSHDIASRQIERGMRDRQLSVSDMSQISAIAGRTGMLSGLTAEDSAGFADSVTDRLIEIEGRVKRLKTALGTDTQGAMGRLIQGMEAGFTEAQAERFALVAPATYRTAGISQAAGGALTGFGGAAFGQMGLSQAAGMNAAQASILQARAFVDSGQFSASTIMQLGGVEGMAELDIARTAQFVAGGFGSALLQADRMDPGLMRRYAMGEASKKDLGNAFAEHRDPLSRMAARYNAAKGLKDVNMDMVGAAADRAFLDGFTSVFGEGSVTQENLEAYAFETGMAGTPAQAEVVAAGAMEWHTDPEAAGERQSMRAAEQSRSQEIAQAREARRQRSFEGRKDFLDSINPMQSQAMINMRNALSGTLKDAARLEDRAEDHMREYQDKLVTASRLGPMEAARLEEEALDDLALRRREDMRVHGGLSGYVRSYTTTLLSDAFYDGMDNIPLWREWAMNKREGMAGKNEEDASNPEAVPMVDGSMDGAQLEALNRVITLLSEISGKID